MILTALLLGLILLVVHFFSENIHIKHRKKIISLSAGVSVTYIFVYLFPEALHGMENASILLFVSVLFGFIILRLIEIHAYRHKSRTALRRERKEAHSASFFIYHIILGIVLYELLQTTFIGGILFFLPLLLYTAISSVSMTEIDKGIKSSTSAKLFLSSSTLIGILIAPYLTITRIFFNVLLGFIIGTMLYIVIRDSMPKEKEALPVYFLAGVSLYLFLIFLYMFFI